jgi:hypothetical protein
MEYPGKVVEARVQGYEKTKSCLSVLPYVYLSVLMERLDSHWKKCYEILYLSIFRKFV